MQKHRGVDQVSYSAHSSTLDLQDIKCGDAVQILLLYQQGNPSETGRMTGGRVTLTISFDPEQERIPILKPQTFNVLFRHFT